ncbi:hypothetical protein BH10BAC5_BH10BAC5_12480 [soil metagenome]
MSIIDHIFTSATVSIGTSPVMPPVAHPYNFNPPLNRNDLMMYEDVSLIENSIQKHWFSMVGLQTLPPAYNYDMSNPPYHLIYSYMLENTRIVQIFEKLLFKFLNDEDLSVNINQDVHQLLLNTESLFYKILPSNASRNISSQIRILNESSRRNSYKRLFGLDLAFGDSSNPGSKYPYHQASIINSDFINLFERFLTEFWNGYINSTNTSGANETDITKISELVYDMRIILMTRRSASDILIPSQYKYYNLTREEFSSTIFLSWLHEIISSNSPLVRFLNCAAPTAGQRLIKIGEKVGVQAHKRSDNLINIAGPMATVLRVIELYINSSINLEDPNDIDNLIRRGIFNAYTPLQKDILTIINEWENATGRRIKSPHRKVSVIPERKIVTNGKYVLNN